MKKIFLDTNIVMDLLVRPDYSLVISEILREGSRRRWRFAVSFLTVANVVYINRKMPLHERHELVRKIMAYFEVVDNTADQISRALALEAEDYEDGLQYECAKDYGCEAIITRNGKDFLFSEVPIYTPQEFLTILREY